MTGTSTIGVIPQRGAHMDPPTPAGAGSAPDGTGGVPAG